MSTVKLLKGCKAYGQRSCQCVADKVLSSRDKKKEKRILKKKIYTCDKGEHLNLSDIAIESIVAPKTLKVTINFMK